MTQNYWKILSVAAIGLLLVCTGLTMAALSNPARFSSSVRNDKFIDLFAGSGFLCTIVGTGLFVTAARSTTKSMPPQNRTNANLGIGLGLVLQLSGLVLPGLLPLHHLSGVVLVLASLPLFIWGAMHYAQGKGHSKWLGIAGMLGVVGLIGLMLLPNNREEAVDATDKRVSA